MDITERSAFGAITNPAEVGYVVREEDGRPGTHRGECRPS